MKKVLLTCVVAALLLAALTIGIFAMDNATLQTIFTAHSTYSEELGAEMPWQLYVPADYDETKSYPVVLFMHGAGERGTDNLHQFSEGGAIFSNFDNPDSPLWDCIVIAPQCPKGSQWVDVADWFLYADYYMDEMPQSGAMTAAISILRSVMDSYSTDRDRVYVTGLSMGGYATWYLLTMYPDVFAAGIPMCGGCDTTKASILVDTPIYAFHGTSDSDVSFTGTYRMYRILTEVYGGTKIRLELNESGHDVWTEGYKTEGLFQWMAEQKLSDRTYDQAKNDAFWSGADQPAPTDTDPVTEPSTAPATNAPDTAPGTDSGAANTGSAPGDEAQGWISEHMTWIIVAAAVCVVAIIAAVIVKKRSKN